MCLHTCSHHAARMTGCAELWPPFCVPTGSAGSPGTPSHLGQGCQVSQGPLSHPPSAQPPGSSLYNTEPTMVFLAHNLSRAPAAPVTKPGAREPGPPPSSLRAEPLLSPLFSAWTQASNTELNPDTSGLCLSLSMSPFFSLSLLGLGDFAGALPAFPFVENSLLRVAASPMSSALLSRSAAAAGREEGRTSVSRTGL